MSPRIHGERRYSFSSFDLYWWTGFFLSFSSGRISRTNVWLQVYRITVDVVIKCSYSRARVGEATDSFNRIFIRKRFSQRHSPTGWCAASALVVVSMLRNLLRYLTSTLLLHCCCRLSGCHRRCRRERDWMWSSVMMDHGRGKSLDGDGGGTRRRLLIFCVC